MIKIFFRFDDPSEISDHALEQKILDVFSKYNAKICLAVIPFKKKWKDIGGKIYPLSREKSKHIINAANSGIAEIALHGFSHVNLSKNATDEPSEFHGISLDEQKKQILKGKNLLEDIFAYKINIFVPPFNSYDEYTIDALKINGFECISAAWKTPQLDFKNNTISILPRTCNLNNFETAYCEAKKYKSLTPTIGVVLHHDEFEEYEFSKSVDNRETFANLDKLERLLRFCKKNDEIEICHISDIFLKNRQYVKKNHLHISIWKEKLHWRIKKFLPTHIIITTSKIKMLVSIIKNNTRLFRK